MEKIKITGMSCGHCTASVSTALEELGLKNVKVSLEDGVAEFENTLGLGRAEIVEAIENIGFDAE